MGHGKGAGEAYGDGTGKATASECIAISATLAFCCLCGSIVLSLLGLGIAKVIIGAIYLHDCNLQSMIPIFLIVSGLAPVLLLGSANRNNEEFKVIRFLCGLIALLFNIAWTVAGSVWVYPTWGIMKTMGNVSCAANATNCMSCNEVVLTFAFAMVSTDWIFLGFTIIYVTCLMYTKLTK